MNYSKLSNNELQLRIRDLSNEYEAKKKQITNLIDRLRDLDKTYTEISNEINKRKKSFVENGKHFN